MNISNGIIPIATAATTGLATLGIAKLAAKKTGKPVGVPASLVHIYTNDKLDKQAKSEVQKETSKELLKTTGKLYSTSAIIGAGAALAAGCSRTVANSLHSAKIVAGEVLSEIAVSGTSLKEIIKANPQFQKFNALPTPAKAGIVAGFAALSLLAPIARNNASVKAGYIEGKHEAK